MEVSNVEQYVVAFFSVRGGRSGGMTVDFMALLIIVNALPLFGDVADRE